MLKNFMLKLGSVGTFNKKKGRKENLSFGMALVGAACILIFPYILRKMDYIPFVCTMCIKMLENTVGQRIRLTPASAALLPAELELQAPLHCVEKETLPCLGLQSQM